MADKSNIGWTDATWNCLYGCSRVSPGCEHCYAERHCHRFSGEGERHEGLTVLRKKGPVWTGKIDLAYHRLFEPFKWSNPRKIFVNSLSDVFHENVPFDFVKAMYGVMACSPHHVFQLLTKREDRMAEFYADMDVRVQSLGGRAAVWECLYWAGQAVRQLHAEGKLTKGQANRYLQRLEVVPIHAVWPLPNVWLGVSTENDEMLNRRVPKLFECEAAVHWISAEPLLSALPSLSKYLVRDANGRRVDWVVAGGESGPDARAMALEWATGARDACAEHGVPFMMKQLGSVLAEQFPGSGTKGTEKEAWPADIRICDYPASASAAA